MVTPAITKRRTPRASRGKVQIASPQRTLLYFDTLPDCANENIVGLVPTKLSGDEGCTSQSRLETVVALVKSGGSLRRAAQNVFRTLQVSVNMHEPQKEDAVQVLGRHEDVEELLKFLSIGLGEGIETIDIWCPLFPGFVRSVAKHCTGLRHLCFTPSTFHRFPNAQFCALIEKRGPTLESLEIFYFSASERLVGAIAQHCRSLLHLKLACSKMESSLETLWKAVSDRLQSLQIVGNEYDGRISLQSLFENCTHVQHIVLQFSVRYPSLHATLENFAGVRKLSFKSRDTVSSQSLRTVLEAHRYSLTSLSISIGRIGECLIATIAEFCQGLIELTVNTFRTYGPISLNCLPRLLSECPSIAKYFFEFGGSEGWETIEEACKPFGAKLFELRLASTCTDVQSEPLGRIADACPNIAIDFHRNKESSGIAIRLGRAAYSWTMTRKTKGGSVFSNVGSSCANLHSISVRTDTPYLASRFSDLFSKPKHKLRDVKMNFGRYEEASAIVLKVFAENHISLKSFSCCGHFVSVEHLRHFLAGQKELEKISFLTHGMCSCRFDDLQKINLWAQGKNDMGCNWMRIVSACIEYSRVGEITCGCAHSSASHLKPSPFKGAFPAAKGRDLTISICGKKIEGNDLGETTFRGYLM